MSVDKEIVEGHVLFNLPYASIKAFGNFFDVLDKSLKSLDDNSGVTVTSL